MKSVKLKQAPLKEVIFEVKWQLYTDERGVVYDPGFDYAVGIFASILKDSFPVHKRITPAGNNQEEYAINRPTFQFWKGELEWPVIQLGPGILSVNSTDVDYIWETTYRTTIQLAMNTLYSSYYKNIIFNNISLQYIDAVDIDDNYSFSEFASVNLQTDLINKYDIPGRLKGMHIDQVFELEDKSNLRLSIQSGVNNNNFKPAMIWVTGIENSNTIPPESVIEWLDMAHGCASALFVNMLNPDFYASFNR